jgi:uncharacterized protein YbaR (Trm112 family)
MAEDVPAPQKVAVDRGLLESLICPATRGALDYDPTKCELVSKAAGLAYPIRDGVPILLIDEARRLES